MPFEKSAYHLATSDNHTLYQPLRENNFELLVDFSMTDGMKGFTDLADNIKIGVVQCRAPHFKLDEVQVSRFNSKSYYAGVPSYEADSVKIDDFYNKSGKSGIMRWMQAAYDVENDAIMPANNYMATATLNEYTPDGTLVRSWTLYNCWIKELNDDSYNAESGSKKQFTATMRYDYAKPIYLD